MSREGTKEEVVLLGGILRMGAGVRDRVGLCAELCRLHFPRFLEEDGCPRKESPRKCNIFPLDHAKYCLIGLLDEQLLVFLGEGCLILGIAWFNL